MSHELLPEWGAVYDGRTLLLSPSPPPAGATLTADRVRFGRTIVDLRAKVRPDRVVIQIAVRFGPALLVRVGLSGDSLVWQVLVDENPVEGTSVSFVASHEHEVQFLMTHDS